MSSNSITSVSSSEMFAPTIRQSNYCPMMGRSPLSSAEREIKYSRALGMTKSSGERTSESFSNEYDRKLANIWKCRRDSVICFGAMPVHTPPSLPHTNTMGLCPGSVSTAGGSGCRLSLDSLRDVSQRSPLAPLSTPTMPLRLRTKPNGTLFPLRPESSLQSIAVPAVPPSIPMPACCTPRLDFTGGSNSNMSIDSSQRGLAPTKNYEREEYVSTPYKPTHADVLATSTWDTHNDGNSYDRGLVPSDAHSSQKKKSRSDKNCLQRIFCCLGG